MIKAVTFIKGFNESLCGYINSDPTQIKNYTHSQDLEYKHTIYFLNFSHSLLFVLPLVSMMYCISYHLIHLYTVGFIQFIYEHCLSVSSVSTHHYRHSVKGSALWWYYIIILSYGHYWYIVTIHLKSCRCKILTYCIYKWKQASTRRVLRRLKTWSYILA